MGDLFKFYINMRIYFVIVTYNELILYESLNQYPRAQNIKNTKEKGRTQATISNHSFLIQSMREKFLVEEIMKNPSH